MAMESRATQASPIRSNLRVVHILDTRCIYRRWYSYEHGMKRRRHG